MAWLLGTWGWRTAFHLLAIPGFLWAALWFALFRDHPRTPPPRDEAAAGPAMTFGEVFRSRRMLLAMAQYFATNFTTFLCLSWMHPYLKQRYQLSATDAALYAMIPLLVGAGAQWATGFLVDRLYRSRYRVWSRRAPAMLGFAISASGLILIPTAATAAAAAACFTLAAFGAEMTISPSWAFCIDIGGSKSGAVAGAMNMLGNFGSFVSANVFPLVEQWTGSADAYFYLVCAMSLGAALCWMGMKSLRQGS
jgi:ACS family glucarate transporter-like MFS transporter